jgi:hypothetical protein
MSQVVSRFWPDHAGDENPGDRHICLSVGNDEFRRVEM